MLISKKIMQNGFYFIEIIMTLVMIGILATFSLPSFTNYLVKTRRLEAKEALTKLAIAAERYEIEHNTYDNMTLATLHAKELIAQNNYQLSIQIKSNQYVLLAKPIHAQKKRDTLCAALILNSKGEKSITGEGSVEDCW